jgi:chromosome partitioning protein
MKILAISNQKGGVGKTTLSVHLAYAAHEKGLRVLIVDFDPQQNTSMMFEPADQSKDYLKTADLFTDERKPLEYIKENFAIIRANEAQLCALGLIKEAPHAFLRLPSKALKVFHNDFDVCVIDTPPAKGTLLDSALVAASHVLTPVKMGKFEMSGFADLLNNINRIRTGGLNPLLKRMGSIPMKVNTRSAKQVKALADFRVTYGSAVLPLIISEREAVQAAINDGRPVWVNVKGVSHKRTALEWREACDLILTILTA